MNNLHNTAAEKERLYDKTSKGLNNYIIVLPLDREVKAQLFNLIHGRDKSIESLCFYHGLKVGMEEQEATIG